MKMLGLIGGMSWESSAEYYRMLNRHSKALHDGHHNAKSVMVTVDFAEIEALQRAHDWPALGAHMAAAARQLEAAGADLIVLTTNTMHRVHDAIERAVALPFLHIADPTGEALRGAGVARSVCADHRRARASRRAGSDTRLHRDYAADRHAGLTAAGVRHDGAACAGGSRMGGALKNTKTKNPAWSRVLYGEARIGHLRCTPPNVLGCGGRI